MAPTQHKGDVHQYMLHGIIFDMDPFHFTLNIVNVYDRKDLKVVCNLVLKAKYALLSIQHQCKVGQ